MKKSKSPAIFMALMLGFVSSMPVGAGPIETISKMWPFKRGAVYEIPLNTVQLVDKAIAKKVLVERVTARRTETDTVKVTVTFFNKGKQPLLLAIRSSFFESEGLPAEPSSGWRTVHIQPKTIATYQETSTGREDVTSFLVEVKGRVSKGL
jgi:hypothetical protein